MRLTTISALTACVATAVAFKDTSPYILFSTSELPSTVKVDSSRQLQSAGSALKITEDFLLNCAEQAYILISQPNVNAADLSDSRAVPILRRAISDTNVRTTVSISEVLGEMNIDTIQEYITSKCGAKVVNVEIDDPAFSSEMASGKTIFRLNFPALPDTQPERAAALESNDDLLAKIMRSAPSKYTVMYLTTPASDKVAHAAYEPVFMEPLHTEMKRQSTYHRRASENSSVPSNAPLFEKYQFFTPGLFMGLGVTFVLISILYVAISAVASLEVSYGAFDKEMGPAAQRKQ